ncbi:sensor histidine kinase [Pelagerythrobacter aerophilus]|nr:ATP-binding protein [Pelagerythrobacter aerophilus]
MIRSVSRPRRRLMLIVVLGLAFLAAAWWAIDRAARLTATDAAAEAARNEAEIMSAGLQSELDKFSLLPLVLAEDPQVRALLAGSTPQAPTLSRRLEDLARQTDAAAIYLMDAQGVTLSASNWRLPTSFVGSDYSFRTYFRDAMKTGSATQFALGTVSREPGLYIAQRVMQGGRPVGVVATKVEFDRLEAQWGAASEGVFVTDRDGVILLASNDAWRFRATDMQRASTRDHALDRQQFGIARLEPFELSERHGGGGLVAAPLLDTEQPIALDGWVLHLLVDPSQRIAASVATGRLYLLLALASVGGLIGLAFYSRRRREKRAEAVLAARTQTLREQLNQANRLATLGQISAGVGHEINQPVAAVRVFAENGDRLIAAGKAEDARGNFARIIELTERIGRITSELRRFSRRDAPEPRVFSLADAVDGALLLLRDRLDGARVALSMPDAAALSVRVRAEPVRLEQVLVNLLQNALDAVGGSGSVTLSVRTDEAFCFLAVQDDGPGFDTEASQLLFQPFATTKPGGLGLGLVISRDIMRDLGGDLTLEESGRGGATFVMKIPRA